ncbi:curli production assembly/transport component CsgG [Halorhodospira halochloris]|uniref:Curli production assembly/transport component CsgG n=1 Tax=Halorhodospira halochloris TaxID=1052 RepID=A0A0X8XAB9_HALHR|nr:curli production assembly/transport component CsgG [Halorhodospira halochloris]
MALSGCTYLGFDATPEWDDVEGPQLGMNTQTFGDLLELPSPAGRIPAAVYGFRDMTGQYREQPHSNLSTAVTQGGGAILTEALLESGWFQPIEREGLQDLLTERRVARQLRDNVAALQEARVLFEGGIVGYDRALTTGGVAARYFGLGASEEYQIDQVTVNLRAVNVENGMVLVSVTTTKTIYSYKVSGGLFRFVRHQRLLDAEGGYTLNEPRLLATSDAISAAVIHLIVRGLVDNHWRLANSEDLDHPIIEAYLVQHRQRLGQGG